MKQIYVNNHLSNAYLINNLQGSIGRNHMDKQCKFSHFLYINLVMFNTGRFHQVPPYRPWRADREHVIFRIEKP